MKHPCIINYRSKLREKALRFIDVAIDCTSDESVYNSTCGHIWMTNALNLITTDEAIELIEKAARKLHEKDEIDEIDEILASIPDETPDYDDPDYLASLQKQAEIKLADEPECIAAFTND